MSYLNTLGKSTLAIGICGRCSRKLPLDDLMPDPNSPGLLVCEYDRDNLDPYRLPPREVEEITLTMPRPDTRIDTAAVAPGSPAWPVSSFPDDGLQSAQRPTTGNTS